MGYVEDLQYTRSLPSAAHRIASS